MWYVTAKASGIHECSTAVLPLYCKSSASWPTSYIVIDTGPHPASTWNLESVDNETLNAYLLFLLFRELSVRCGCVKQGVSSPKYSTSRCQSVWVYCMAYSFSEMCTLSIILIADDNFSFDCMPLILFACSEVRPPGISSRPIKHTQRPVRFWLECTV